MDSDSGDYVGEAFGNINAKVRDIEEKQRILKDRLLLVGNNLIENREKTNEKILDLKKNVESLKTDVERIKSLLDMISNELSSFAKKQDLEILSKQARMFQPLKLK